MAELTMPRLSDTMSEGSISRWLKKPGDQVAVGDIIAEIETDKATMELEAFENGTLQQIVVNEGQVVPIGTVIGMIGNGPLADAPAAPAPAAAPQAEAPAAPAPAAASQAAPAAPAPAAPAPPAPPAAATNGDGQIKASPLARRIADESGIDLRQVQGSGPGGRILKENVEEFLAKGGAPAASPAAPAPAAPVAPAPAPAAPAAKAPAPAPAPASAEAAPMSRMRKAIARAMSESKPGIPHIYVTAEVDMAAAMALRQQIIDSGAAPVKVSVNDLVVKAVARALVKFPNVNTSFASTPDGQPAILTHSGVHVSVAVALEDGLIAPVVKDADKKSIGTIAAEIKGMAARAREGKIKQNELEGATFQVSNLGMYDVVEFVSIITAPQAASLAVGAVRQVPVVRDGQVTVGQMMLMTISADHRVIDGVVAAQFLQEVRRLLEAPMALLV